MKSIPKTPRLASIDQFRGFAILLMVLANFMGDVNSIPAWLKHAHDIGLTVIDLIAPFFIFAIGLTYRLSLQRRVAVQGWEPAVEHFVRRWLVLLGIGALLVTGEIIIYSPGETNWGVLQAIAVAGLVTLPALLLPTWGRALAGLGLLVGYQLMLDKFWLPQVLGAPHGGLLGALSWSAMLILATVLADLFHDEARGRGCYGWVSGLTLAAGLLLALWAPVSKNRVSASYVLISLGASALLFGLFHLLCDRRGLSFKVFAVWGMNPLLLYVLHQILLGLIVLPPWPLWNVDAPIWLAVLQMAGLVAALSWIGLFLQRKKWVFIL
jgi:predicted acyltransferase